MQSLGLLGLVFDTGLSVTPLMGHLGCLASHWSDPVLHRQPSQLWLEKLFFSPKSVIRLQVSNKFRILNTSGLDTWGTGEWAAYKYSRILIKSSLLYFAKVRTLSGWGLYQDWPFYDFVCVKLGFLMQIQSIMYSTWHGYLNIGTPKQSAYQC